MEINHKKTRTLGISVTEQFVHVRLNVAQVALLPLGGLKAVADIVTSARGVRAVRMERRQQQETTADMLPRTAALRAFASLQGGHIAAGAPIADRATRRHVVAIDADAQIERRVRVTRDGS
jgi:hypothetical protein